jgi:hypothetical protein
MYWLVTLLLRDGCRENGGQLSVAFLMYLSNVMQPQSPALVTLVLACCPAAAAAAAAGRMAASASSHF